MGAWLHLGHYIGDFGPPHPPPPTHRERAESDIKFACIYVHNPARARFVYDLERKRYVQSTRRIVSPTRIQSPLTPPPPPYPSKRRRTSRPLYRPRRRFKFARHPNKAKPSAHGGAATTPDPRPQPVGGGECPGAVAQVCLCGKYLPVSKARGFKLLLLHSEKLYEKEETNNAYNSKYFLVF